MKSPHSSRLSWKHQNQALACHPYEPCSMRSARGFHISPRNWSRFGPTIWLNFRVVNPHANAQRARTRRSISPWLSPSPNDCLKNDEQPSTAQTRRLPKPRSRPNGFFPSTEHVRHVPVNVYALDVTYSTRLHLCIYPASIQVSKNHHPSCHRRRY